MLNSSTREQYPLWWFHQEIIFAQKLLISVQSTSIWGSVSKELQWAQSGEFEIFILYNLLPYGNILWIILYWNIHNLVSWIFGFDKMATPLLCLLPWQKWILLPHSVLYNFSWLLELYVSCRKITEAFLLWSCLKIARLFRELFMPLTLSVIKLNLCITNHNCLWKRPACDKRLPLRISYRTITITTQNNT